MVESVRPSILPTSGGLLEVRGIYLAGAQVSLDESGLSRLSAEQPRSVASMRMVDNLGEEKLLLEIGPGVGAQY
jgi:hypothetical protein